MKIRGWQLIRICCAIKIMYWKILRVIIIFEYKNVTPISKPPLPNKPPLVLTNKPLGAWSFTTSVISPQSTFKCQFNNHLHIAWNNFYWQCETRFSNFDSDRRPLLSFHFRLEILLVNPGNYYKKFSYIFLKSSDFPI